MKIPWLPLLLGYFAGCCFPAIAQTIQLNGRINNAQTNQPIARVTVCGFSKEGVLISKSISDMDGYYQLLRTQEIALLEASHPEHYTARLPVRMLNHAGESAVFYTPVRLHPIPTQSTDPVYDQRTQKHTEISPGTAGTHRFTRVFEVVDGDTGSRLENAAVCLIRTQNNQQECFTSDHGRSAFFSIADIVAIEVKCSGYDDFYGNLILHEHSPRQATYRVRLHRRQALLSVYGAQSYRLVGQNYDTPLVQYDSLSRYAFAKPGSYTLRPIGSGRPEQKLELSQGIHFLVSEVETSAQLQNPDGDSVLIYFHQSDYVLSAVSMAQLDSLAGFLKRNPGQKAVIVGHTDNVGPENRNQILSEYRAKVTYNYMIGKKVNRSQLSWKGVGIHFPVHPNDSESNRKKNRRVVITYHHSP